MRKKKLLKYIDELEERLKYLENLHARRYDPTSWELPRTANSNILWRDDDDKIRIYRDRQLCYSEFCEHPQPASLDYSRIVNIPEASVDTARVPKVTLKELACYVLDHTPIRREELITAKRISTYTEDAATDLIIPEESNETEEVEAGFFF